MLTEQDVIARLRAAIDEAGGQRAFARKHGFTPAYINDMLRGRRTVAEKVLEALGIERVVTHSVTYHERNVATNVAESKTSDKPPHQDAKSSS